MRSVGLKLCSAFATAACNLVPREEPPHRSVAKADAVALPDLLAQLYDRQLRLVLDLREVEIGMSLNALRSAIAAHLQCATSPVVAARLAQRTTVVGPISNRAAALRRDISPSIAFITFLRISIDSGMIRLRSPRRVPARGDAFSDMGILGTLLNPILNPPARTMLGSYRRRRWAIRPAFRFGSAALRGTATGLPRARAEGVSTGTSVLSRQLRLALSRLLARLDFGGIVRNGSSMRLRKARSTSAGCMVLAKRRRRIRRIPGKTWPRTDLEGTFPNERFAASGRSTTAQVVGMLSTALVPKAQAI